MGGGSSEICRERIIILEHNRRHLYSFRMHMINCVLLFEAYYCLLYLIVKMCSPR